MITADDLQRPETLTRPASPRANLYRALFFILLPFLLALAACTWLRLAASHRVWDDVERIAILAKKLGGDSKDKKSTRDVVDAVVSGAGYDKSGSGRADYELLVRTVVYRLE